MTARCGSRIGFGGRGVANKVKKKTETKTVHLPPIQNSSDAPSIRANNSIISFIYSQAEHLQDVIEVSHDDGVDD